MKRTKRAALYARVSHDEQKFGFSIQNQIERLRKYAEEENILIVDEFVDEGFSAGTTKRPALQEMLSRLKEFDEILFTKLDRFTRNVLDANEMVKTMHSFGVAIKAIDEEDIDTSTADGEFIFNMKVSLAQRELKKGSERIKTVFEYKVNHGQPISGGVTFGYKIETDEDGKKKIVKNEEEAHIVEEIFDHFLHHQSIRQTALYINDKHDLNLEYITYNRILKRPMYAGIYRGNENYCEPYITKETFDKVQSIRANNIRVRKNNYIYLFSGLVVCQCGHKMVGLHTKNPQGKVYYYYRCNKSRIAFACDAKHIREDMIEDYLLQNINRLANEYIYTASVEIDKKPKPRIDIKEITDEMDALNYMFRKKRIPPEEYDYEYGLLEKKLIEAKKEMPEEADLTGLQAFLNSDWQKVYHALDKTEQRALWRSVIREISINDDGEVTVEFL